MLTDKKIDQVINYWLTSSQEKLKTAQTLYKNKRYADCLFFCHLTLEKILKAITVKNTKQPAPYTHNLSYLAKLSNLSLSKKELLLLAKTNEFNMEARYPDEKLSFYRLCTKTYTDKYYQATISLYKILCRLVRQK